MNNDGSQNRVILGTNIMHLSPNEACLLGTTHLEISRSNGINAEDAELKTTAALNTLVQYIQTRPNVGYSIHLPLVMGGYKHHVFSSFFLDADQGLVEEAFDLLVYNFEQFRQLKPKFYVTHFSGIYEAEDTATFNSKLLGILDRLNDLCIRYDVILLLEYFGFNKNMIYPQDWAMIQSFKNLGILLDTGHLYYSMIVNDLENKGWHFSRLLEEFLPMTSAVHLWNTHSEPGAYEHSHSYMQYHHLVPRIEQNRNKGYAIDICQTLALLKDYNIPIIIEASEHYGGAGEVGRGIKELFVHLMEETCLD